jgi:hypothetical protein
VSREDERLVAQLLSKRLSIRLNGQKYRTTWGEVDGHAVIGPQSLLLLEVERSQNHPASNVLKIWPFLQQNSHFRVVLAHAFFPDSRGLIGSRRLLTDWIAGTLETELRGRFTYCRLMISLDFCRVNGIGKLIREVRKHQRRR